MRRIASVPKVLFGVLFLLTVIFLGVYTEEPKEELVTQLLEGVPVKVPEELGLQVSLVDETVDIEVKGTREQMKELDPYMAVVELELTEQGTGEIDGSSPEVADQEKEEPGESEVEYLTNVKVSGLEGYLYEVLTDVVPEITKIEGQLADVKIKVKGTTEKEIESIKVLDELYTYYTEEELEQITEIGLFIDLVDIAEDDTVLGEVKVLGENGEELEHENKIDKTELQAQVLYKPEEKPKKEEKEVKKEEKKEDKKEEKKDTENKAKEDKKKG